MFLSSRAIVLSKVRHTDSTFIATLYTEFLGSVAFAVRIPKSSRAAIKPQLFQPLTLLTIEWDNRESLSLQRLRNAQLLAPYSTLHTHPGKAATATFLAETLYHALRQEHSGDIFRLSITRCCGTTALRAALCPSPEVLQASPVILRPSPEM